eukprot:6789658-Karenia_brevis.AAC.1
MPDVISFNAAISACEKGGRWEHAVLVLDKLLNSGTTADVISFSAAMSACAKGGQWLHALSTFDKMRNAGMVPE